MGQRIALAPMVISTCDTCGRDMEQVDQYGDKIDIYPCFNLTIYESAKGKAVDYLFCSFECLIKLAKQKIG